MFKSVFTIINYKTFIVTVLSVVATYFCTKYEIHADFPLNLVGIAIVFPVVFSIDSAYKRREHALSVLSDFKAHLLSTYYASRDWVDAKDKNFPEKVKAQLKGLYSALRDTFTVNSSEKAAKERILYKKLSALSSDLQEFREHGLQVGEMSRVNQYISKMSVSIENMLVILHYRTPITLRAYSKIFIYSFPVLYAPYFVAVSIGYTEGLQYMMPVVFSFILVSLDNIQNHLENPFDQIGVDDIKFDVEEYSEMMN